MSTVFGKLGKLMKLASVPVAFANPLLGAGLRFGGSIADKSDDEGGLKKMKLFKEGIAPAALTFGGGKLAGAMRAAKPVGDGVSQLSSLGLADAAVPIGQEAAAGNAGGSFLSGVGEFIKKNPATVMQGVGAGLDFYGAQRDADTQRMLLQRQLDEEDEEKRKRKRVSMEVGPMIAELMKSIGPVPR